MKIERILITGGAGFIGSYTVDLLLREGKEVVVLDNLSSGKRENLPLHHPRLQWVEGDVLEYPLVENLLKNCDAVLHLAAIASVPFSIENPIYSFQVNTQGFLHVLQAIHKAKRAIRLVYASSAAVYGDQSPCSDETPLSGSPLSPYALQKIHNEQYADLYARLYGISSLALRYFNVYGERQDPHSFYAGVISRFLYAYQDRAKLLIFGDGQQSRDFIYATEVAQANWQALQSDYRGVLNIATGRAETLLSMIQYLEKVGAYPAELRFEPARAGDIVASYAMVDKAKQCIGFKSSVSLQEGMRLMAKMKMEKIMQNNSDTAVASAKRACAKRHHEMLRADLPLRCPTQNEAVWDAHPRVYLPIEVTGRYTCPYCGTEYLLKDF